ncbi:rhomboid family intramembrane serine protease [Stappia stellulata]|uniref:rhomboid family intramembrane serine protease n=1 Tax=Stappia TaxID=152161 RepID=UPI001CD4EE75|nr:rhomboid family intramembrane serine protease [Stappia stellulata]MCA1242591.1 rhomboid family intramembrane serine protease [Stappia stellulata]|eukprot:jgi/Tetstr1/428682/TSEL_018670.t1
MTVPDIRGSSPELPPPSQPIFNLPPVITWLAGILIAIHVVSALFLSRDAAFELIIAFGFLPARYSADFLPGVALPGGAGADVWTFLTYAFLHGGWAHLFVNVLWMAVFGSAVARRLGTLRFLLLSALCAISGAALHLYLHFGEAVPMIGASAAISGQMAAATRFVFQDGGPLGTFRRSDNAAYLVPAKGVVDSLANPRVAMFLTVWFGINLVFGLISTPFGGSSGSVAWEAHIGGFVAGFALFSLFDPVPRRRG